MKLESVSIKRSEQLTEKWVQDQIADDPSLLGLGDLELKDKERIQSNAGRLDLLLQEPVTLKRYEVEIQLGARPFVRSTFAHYPHATDKSPSVAPKLFLRPRSGITVPDVIRVCRQTAFQRRHQP
jgi:hypothetical protein